MLNYWRYLWIYFLFPFTCQPKGMQYIIMMFLLNPQLHTHTHTQLSKAAKQVLCVLLSTWLFQLGFVIRKFSETAFTAKQSRMSGWLDLLQWKLFLNEHLRCKEIQGNNCIEVKLYFNHAAAMTHTYKNFIISTDPIRKETLGEIVWHLLFLRLFVSQYRYCAVWIDCASIHSSR